MIQKLALILTFLSVPSVFSQTVDLGFGTTESSSYDASPVNIYYRRTVSQFIYTAAELQAAGASSSTPISEIGFYITEAPVFTLPNYRIRVKHTNQTDVSSAVSGGGWINIINGISYDPTAGNWDMLTTNGSFTWDGTSNLAFEVCWSRVSPTWWPSGKVRIDPTVDGYRFSRTDAAGNSCGTIPTSISTNRPQVRLVFIAADTTYWTGSVSTNWLAVSNWTAGVPTRAMNAVIPSGTTFMPAVPGSDVKTKYLRIESGATLTLQNPAILHVYGDFVNNGALITNQSTVCLDGTALTSLSMPSNQVIYDLEIDNPFGVDLVSGNIRIQNYLSLKGGNFTTGNAVTLLSNATGTARITEINGQCAYTLNMYDSYGDGWNGASLTVMVNGVSTGKYAAAGSFSSATIYAQSGSDIELFYIKGNYENENSYELVDPSGNTVFSDGGYPNEGSVYSATSSCAFVNPVVGDIDVQRSIDAGATHWRFLSPPISGADLEDYDDDFITSGIPGTDYPNWPSASNPWPSFYFYSESLGTTFDDGFYVPASTSELINTGHGMWVWCGDNSSGTQPFTIDTKGPINAGTIDLPVSFTVASGNMENDGWNMVGNPYPCTIDWDSPNWTKTNIEDAIYIWNPDLQQYASYIAGVGTNGADNMVASSQAFMVHADGNNPVLTVRESCKANQDAAFLKANVSQDLLRIQVKKGPRSDETVLRFDNNASDGFDKSIDARKPLFNGSIAPSIATVMFGKPYSVNTIPLFETVRSIPVRFTAAQNGSHTMLITDRSAIENMSCIILEDLFTGTVLNLATDTTYTFNANVTDNPDRFVLHISESVEVLPTDATCVGVEDGMIRVNGVFETYSYLVSSNEFFDSSSVSGSDTIATGLKAGSYNVLVNNGFGCEESATVVIEAPQILMVSPNVKSPSCSGCSDGSVVLNVTGGIPPYTVITESTDNWMEGVLHDASAGTYEFVLTDGHGCSLQSTITVSGVLSVGSDQNVTFSVYPNPAHSSVRLTGLPVHEQVEIRNSAGQLVKQLAGQSGYEIDTNTWPSGIYYIFRSTESPVKLMVTH